MPTRVWVLRKLHRYQRGNKNSTNWGLGSETLVPQSNVPPPLMPVICFTIKSSLNKPKVVITEDMPEEVIRTNTAFRNTEQRGWFIPSHQIQYFFFDPWKHNRGQWECEDRNTCSQCTHWLDSTSINYFYTWSNIIGNWVYT